MARRGMVGVVMWGSIAGLGWGQTTGTGRMPAGSTLPGGISDSGRDSHTLSPNTQEKMAIAREDERQKRLQADTTQLLALATKLKEDMDKTDKYTLSLDVMKRTAEIERLAKAIRERMKE